MKTKMQIAVTSLALVLLSLFASVRSDAQTPPDQNPPNLAFLASTEVYMAYAVDRASGGYDNLSANQYNWSSWQEFSIPSNHTSADIIAAINSVYTSIDVNNANDIIFKYIVVNDVDGNELFTARSTAQPYFTAFGYKLPPFNFGLNLSDPTISFDSPVDSAYMEYTDAIGMSQYARNYGVSGNKVTVPLEDLGQGMLHVRMKDGRSFVYDLRQNGVQVGEKVLTETIQGQGSIKNLVPVTVTNSVASVSDTVNAYNGIGFNDPIELNVRVMSPTNPASAVTFNVRTSEGYKPFGFYYRQKSNGLWQYVPNALPTPPIIFGNGVWYIIPAWNQYELSPPQPGYGYGGITATTTMENAKGAGSEPTPATNSGQ